MFELLKEFLTKKSAFTRMSRGFLFAGAAFLATPDGQETAKSILGPNASALPAALAAAAGLMAVGEKNGEKDE